jgi:hypothetical protein
VAGAFIKVLGIQTKWIAMEMERLTLFAKIPLVEQDLGHRDTGAERLGVKGAVVG